MRDPFKPHTNHQLVREAQFGFTVVGMLVATLIYVAWFRLHGGDRLPENIRNSPVAMNVYPNSPNYDHDAHQMVAAGKTSADGFDVPRAGVQAKLTSEPRRTNPLIETPKKIMIDSQRTARRLSQEAASIDRSATKVATLLKPTKRKTAAAEFAPVAVPTRKVTGPEKLKPALASPPPAPLTLPPAPTKIESTPARPLHGKPKDVSPLKQTTAPLRKPAVSGFNPDQFSPFKPAATQASTETAATEPTLPKLGTATTEPTPLTSVRKSKNSSLPTFPSRTIRKPAELKLRPQALPPLRPSKPTPLPSSSLEARTKPTSKLAPRTPIVQTVSFESTTWKVKQGDSFWSIAQQSYGDGRFFRALYEANRKLVPGFENLHAGLELDVPSEEQLLQRHPSLCPADAVHRNDPWRATPDDLMEDLTENCDTDLNQRFYETKAKDTLFRIAQQQLGQASRYVELLELNRFRIPADAGHQTLLPVGVRLLLPLQ